LAGTNEAVIILFDAQIARNVPKMQKTHCYVGFKQGYFCRLTAMSGSGNMSKQTQRGNPTARS
jgi:hypothetical protein